MTPRLQCPFLGTILQFLNIFAKLVMRLYVNVTLLLTVITLQIVLTMLILVKWILQLGNHIPKG